MALRGFHGEPISDPLGSKIDPRDPFIGVVRLRLAGSPLNGISVPARHAAKMRTSFQRATSGNARSHRRKHGG